MPLGSDTCASPKAWQEHDLEIMLLASRKTGKPMIIGSAGDTGTNSRVDMYVQIIRDLAKKHDLPPFRIGWFYSEVDKEMVRAKIRGGSPILGLDGRPELDEEELDATSRIVAMAGVHPFLELLEEGCDVIIGGRSSDSAVFACAALAPRLSGSQAYYLGKVLECASFCAEPYGAKETVMGEITEDFVEVTAMQPGPALHHRLGRRPRHVRALQPVPRICRRRPARHDRLPLRAGVPRKPPASPACASSRPRISGSSWKAPASSASVSSAWPASAIPTPSPMSTR